MTATFINSFILFFVAIDTIGNVPFFLSLTEDIKIKERNRKDKHNEKHKKKEKLSRTRGLLNTTTPKNTNTKQTSTNNYKNKTGKRNGINGVLL